MKCNSKCKICSIWRNQGNYEEMTQQEVYDLLDDARKEGFVSYVVLGGEPLLRPDLIEILEYAYSKGFYTTIITNGYYLEQKAEKLAKAAKLTWVSLDYDSDYHDEMRGLTGSFEAAVKGIKRMKKNGGRVSINCVLSNMNLDVPHKMVNLAKDLDVFIAFDPIEVFDFNEEYALSVDERKQVFREIIELKKAGYPVLNAYEFLEHQINPIDYECAQSRVFLKVESNGDIHPFWCPGNLKPLGNVRSDNLGDILDSESYRQFTENSKKCNKCMNSSTVESSIFYSTRGLLRNLPKRMNKYLRFALDYGFS